METSYAQEKDAAQHKVAPDTESVKDSSSQNVALQRQASLVNIAVQRKVKTYSDVFTDKFLDRHVETDELQAKKRSIRRFGKEDVELSTVIVDGKGTLLKEMTGKQDKGILQSSVTDNEYLMITTNAKGKSKRVIKKFSYGVNENKVHHFVGIAE